jgi:uncharacterized protein
MGRLLILLLIVGVAAWWIYHRISRLRSGTDASRPSPPRAGKGAVQDMVACAHCGVHLPQAEAVRDGELHYCGDGHRRLGPRA